MKRQNDFAGEMGKRYQEAMEVICPQDKTMKDIIADRVRLLARGRNNATYADLGCGNGDLIKQIYLAQKKYHSYDLLFLLGVDSSKEMIESASETLREGAKFKTGMPGGNVEIYNDDLVNFLDRLPPTLAISCNFVLHNFTKSERKEVLPRIYKALSPEGVFYLGDKIARTNPEEHAQDYATQLELVKSLAQHGMPELVQPWLDHYEMDNAPERRMVEGELVDQLKSVGFKEVNVLYREKMEAIVEARK